MFNDMHCLFLIVQVYFTSYVTKAKTLHFQVTYKKLVRGINSKKNTSKIKIKKLSQKTNENK